MNELICADCGASDPVWASLNHGVLICSDCCFVHRNLGRNVSQIRSLTKGMWHDKQLALINYLYKNGSNNIWEHTLLDQGGRTKRKPVSNDPIIPKKESFIIDKYANLAFSIRPAKDEFTVDDLNKQLWSCVRTGHVETSLRLLALGASPNCNIQGNTPLHIAAKNGQDLQMELLWIYGADVEQKNSSGRTPEEIARIEGHSELSKRFMELSFEVTDHFSMFLCGRKPSHQDSHQHFLIPDLVMPRTNQVNDLRQLQLSNGNVFERLIQDVYDEIDRRELNVQWSTIEQLHIRTHQHVAIFLPPNPKLSATKNQLRQKLAKFSSADFAHLIIDLLKEVRRRYYGLPIPVDEQSQQQQITRNIDLIFANNAEMDETNSPKKSIISTNSNNLMDISNQNKMAFSSMDHYLEFKEKWADTDEKMEKLSSSNAKILKTLLQIQKTVEQLQIEQSDIQYEMNKVKQQQQQRLIASPPPASGPQQQSQMTPPLHHNSALATTSTTNLSPSKIGAVMISASTLKPVSQSHPQKPLHNYSTDTYPSAKISTRQASASNLLPTTIQNVQNSNSVAILNQPPQQKKHSIHSAKTIFNDEIFPDNLILETELLTNAIKALLSDLQNAPKTSNREANAMYHADSINHHILRILSLIPEHFMRGGPVRQRSIRIEFAMKQLSRKCLSRPLNIDETCQAAYDIAKTAKELLVTVHGQTEQH